MNVLVVYDSVFGNTAKVAGAIAQNLGEGARILATASLTDHDLLGVELLVVGCPIHSWRPSEAMAKFLGTLRAQQLRGIQAVAFDTRVRGRFQGNAAGKIERALRRAGAHMVAPPQPFCVTGKEGPLEAGELEKAAAWGRSLAGAHAAFSAQP